MPNRVFTFIAVITITMAAGSCKLISGKKKSASLPNDGQLHGVSPGKAFSQTKPPGMVYIPAGTFHMGPSDEDVNYS